METTLPHMTIDGLGPTVKRMHMHVPWWNQHRYRQREYAVTYTAFEPGSSRGGWPCNFSLTGYSYLHSGTDYAWNYCGKSQWR